MIKDGNEAKYKVEPEVSQVFNHGFKKNEISIIEAVIEENRQVTMQRQIEKVWIDEEYVNAITKDGLMVRYAISSWPRLAAANKSQLADFYLSYSGIHWPQIDEDLSFEGLFSAAGLCGRTPEENSKCFIQNMA